MHVVIRPGRARTFNGLKIINPDKKHPVAIIVEPSKRVVESHGEERRIIDTGEDSGVD